MSHRHESLYRRSAVWPLFGWLLTATILAGGHAWGQVRSLRFQNLNQRQGLSQGFVNSVIQDRYGFMWMGTQDGLNRFDGFAFQVFLSQADDPDSISDDWIWCLLEDREGAIWIGTRSGGLNRYDPIQRRFRHYLPDPAREDGIGGANVHTLLEDRDGRLWLGTRNGGLNRMNADGSFSRFVVEGPAGRTLSDNWVHDLMEDREGRIWIATNRGLDVLSADRQRIRRFHHDPGDPTSLACNRVWSLMEDSKGIIWVGTATGGLNRFDPLTETFKTFRHDPQRMDSLSIDFVLSIHEARNGDLWVGTWDGGLNRFDRREETFEVFKHDRADPESICDNVIWDICQDRTGILWFGTMGGGIGFFNPRSTQFQHYKHLPDRNDSLSGSDVRAIMEDRSGLLWIGTENAGVTLVDRATDAVLHLRHDPDRSNTLCSEIVHDIHQTETGDIWIATYCGINRLVDRDRFRFERILPDENDPHALSGHYPFTMLDDAQDHLWVGHFGHGLDRRDPDSGRFTHFRHDPQVEGSISSDSVSVLMRDDRDRLWVGTDGGLNRYDPETERFTSYLHRADRAETLSHSYVTALHVDGRGRMWVGTLSGLNLMNAEETGFLRFGRGDGLPNDTILGILSEEGGPLWLTTNKGVVRMNPETGAVRLFDPSDGLQGNEFNLSAYWKTPNGEMMIGGTNGLNIFHPERITKDPYPPQVVLVDFLVLNRSVAPSTPQRPSPLDLPIDFTTHIELDHRQSVFGFNFAALHYADAVANRYRYKLEGFDGDWAETDARRRFATYTNLDAGRYRFRVIAANKDGVWNRDGASVTIDILPPPWKTWWAYTAYGLALLGLVGFYVRGQRRKLAYERAVNERLKQVDQLKDEFLANTSHELRTPLNGIVGLAESLGDGIAGSMPDPAKDYLGLIVSSAKRLNHLVDDILDFSRLKNRNLTLSCGPVDLKALTDIVVRLSSALKAKPDLVLANRIPGDRMMVWADENRVIQILHNLVGNALKFTHEGSVTISAEPEGDMVRVSVCDTGIGIAEEHRDRIFSSFEQADASTARQYGGTGLGLAVSRRLVELHEGRIWVESEVGVGSTFHFTLPVFRGEVRDEDSAPRAEAEQVSHVVATPGLDVLPEPELDSEVVSTAGYRVLVVDDEPVNREVLRAYLAPHGFQLTLVADAFAAQDEIDRAATEQGENAAVGPFDLVLLDVMMPRQSGFTFCQTLRARYDAYQLPVIFLTAKNRVTDLVLGFESGANDYLAKPIQKGELLARVRMHLMLRDLNRDLEQKVRERTAELAEKNRLMADQNRELETLDTIVAAMNRKVHFDDLLSAMLVQGMRLIRAAEVALCLVYRPQTDGFELLQTDNPEATTPGIASPESTCLSFAQLTRGYLALLSEPMPGVFLSEPDRRGPVPRLGSFSVPAAVVAVAMSTAGAPEEGRLGAVLVFHHHEDPEAFLDLDLAQLSRFRAHAESAVNKAQIIDQLVRSRKELIETAHRAGMAEIAVEVVHNAGNVLNSVRTSVDVLEHQLNQNRGLDVLGKTHKLVDDLDLRTISSDPRAARISEALFLIHRLMEEREGKLLEETRSMAEHVSALQSVLAEQRKHAEPSAGLAEPEDVNDLIRAILKEERILLENLPARLVTQLSPVPRVPLDAIKFKRILLSLLKNAWEAIEAALIDNGRIEILTGREAATVKIVVSDNGVGFDDEGLRRAFTQGFSTKNGKLGMGLHYCANAMRALSGSIHLESEGPGRGTRVSLVFPTGDAP
ncbi:two-component regulator propeller domain-containing protein [Sulfidibacter corallicola]|uniref:histidine kinase n=1 Tax=Sulfidibacter corallicola TaxID=2818388 RepID=A0A8A4TLS4_SULCO|nr:two-component regulator propeller domain-containing protein [Sulfidibacter corallicola]QTD49831.1 response regulator [Sulfidibacter corallicola]